MEEDWILDRAQLRDLIRLHSDWSITQLTQATGRSRGWVKKWRKRLKEADLQDDSVVHSRSRRHTSPYASLHPEVEQAILHLRDTLPAQLHRVVGPKTILYYLHQDASLQQPPLRLPTSTSTIWKVLDRHGRIIRRPAYDHEPLDRPEPMQEWEVDFTDVPTVTPDPDGKRQHMVEALNIVDRGTSILVDSLPYNDYNAETALVALTDVFLKEGLPQRIRIDRDARFVGSWSGSDFPSPLVRYLGCLDIAVDLCPPQRPDLKPFVERFNKTLEYECIRPANPKSLEATKPLLEQFKPFYNGARPHQGLSCQNRPPFVAFPTRPTLRALPRVIDPDRWLNAFHHLRFKRRVAASGVVMVDRYRYYIGRELKGRYLIFKLDAHRRCFDIEFEGKVVKTLPVKGLFNGQLLFEDYFELMCREARSTWRRLQQARHRRLS